MNLQHINIKFFVAGPLKVDPEQFIQVFHRWVAEQAMNELLIDIADYRHVPAGPGVLLVGLEADYGFDMAENRPGLLYNRKAPVEGSATDRLQQAFTAAAHAAHQLESEVSDLAFDYSECEISINDRAIAPNSPETFATFQPVLADYLENGLGQSGAEIRYDDRDSRRRFRVVVKFPQPVDIQNIAVAS